MAKVEKEVAAPERSEARAQGSRTLELIKSVAVILILFFVIRAFLVKTFVITSGSMEDTLLVGDFLLINKAAYGAVIPGTRSRLPGYTDPQRGDVIVFRADHEPDMDLVKRLIGLPGDTLAMRDGVLYLNGAAQVEPYVRELPDAQDTQHPWFEWQRAYLVDSVNAEAYRPTLHHWGPLVVPADHFFVMGDNRDQSLDSRFWGLVEEPEVEGKAIFLYWSYDAQTLRPFPWITSVRWERIGDLIR